MSKRSQKAAGTATIYFELFAPRIEDAKLLGEWNAWQPMPMAKQANGSWEASVPLADGDYHYQFQIKSNSPKTQGQMLTLPDPTAVQFGRNSDDSQYSIVKVREGKRVITTYQWQHDDVPLPPNEQLIIYEMHLGDFRGGQGDTAVECGDFKNAIEKLDYLAQLGINAVELIPVNETPSSNYWGYSQSSVYAVENTYGTPDDLCRFVDECHARGMRVIHDAVFNHLAEDAPLTQIDYAYWFYENNPDKPELHFGPKFNYEFYDEERKVWPAREHVIGALELWITEFHMDGIRIDSTRAVKHYDLLKWFNDESHNRAGFKPFYTIAEHLPQDPSITGVNGPIDAAWHDNFYRQMVVTLLGVPDENHQPFVTDEVLRVMDARKDGYDSAYNVVNYLNNHDLERLMYLFGAQAHIFDDDAFERNKLGITLLMTTPGIPMLWMGEEFGQANPKSEDRAPLDWSLLNNERNSALWEHYRLMIELRKSIPALYSDTFEIIADLPDRGVIAFKRWVNDEQVVIVLANLLPQYAGQVEIKSPHLDDGNWHELRYNYDVLIHQNCLSDTLGASEAKIYLKSHAQTG